MQLQLTNVINVSISEAQAGVGNYNTSNLAIFSDEVPAVSFGSLGYAQYVDPTQVGVDFGTSSKTYAMANAIFSQQPNILAGSGQLVVILITPATQHIAFSGTPASGAFVLNYGASPTASIAWNDTAAMIQTKLRAITTLSEVLVTGSMATTLNIQFQGVYGVQALLTVSSNTLMTSAPAAITPTVTTTVVGETLAAAITRTKDLVQYFGLISDDSLNVIGQTDLLAAAAVIQPLNKIGFFVSRLEADIQTGGMLDLLQSGGFDKSRGLYYGSTTDIEAVIMAASYAGRALSTDFSGSNTTSTMHLKDLVGVQPDPTMTQTILNEAQAAGADVYVSLQGVAKVFCSGENKFFDQVYNRGWLTGALQVAGFNYLAQTNTKIPQTENGMDGLKGAYRDVLEQGITNQYGAPGRWTSSTLFGNTADLIANVAQRGYYIFSVPLSQQSQADRAIRKAPLAQIAFKEAGAMHKSNVIVNINA